MLQLVPQSWFAWNFDVLENDRPIAEIKTSSLRESGTISIDGPSYSAYREGLLSGDFILEQNGQPLVRAQKPSAFLNSFNVEHSGRSFTLQKESLIGRSFVLMEGNCQTGSIQAKGFLTRKADVDLPQDMPMPVRVFVLWLAILLWRREANAGAAAAST